MKCLWYIAYPPPSDPLRRIPHVAVKAQTHLAHPKTIADLAAELSMKSHFVWYDFYLFLCSPFEGIPLGPLSFADRIEQLHNTPAAIKKGSSRLLSSHCHISAPLHFAVRAWYLRIKQSFHTKIMSDRSFQERLQEGGHSKKESGMSMQGALVYLELKGSSKHSGNHELHHWIAVPHLVAILYSAFSRASTAGLSPFMGTNTWPRLFISWRSFLAAFCAAEASASSLCRFAILLLACKTQWQAA